MSDERRLVHLPGTRLTPDVVLHRTLGSCARIKAVAVVVQWDDDTYAADWSQMRVSELVMMSAILNEEARVSMRGGNPAPASPPESE